MEGLNNKKEPKERYTISCDLATYKRIEDFRFANRYNTKGEATVALILKGLEEYEKRLGKGDE